MTDRGSNGPRTFSELTDALSALIDDPFLTVKVEWSKWGKASERLEWSMHSSKFNIGFQSAANPAQLLERVRSIMKIRSLADSAEPGVVDV